MDWSPRESKYALTLSLVKTYDGVVPKAQEHVAKKTMLIDRIERKFFIDSCAYHLGFEIRGDPYGPQKR